MKTTLAAAALVLAATTQLAHAGLPLSSEVPGMLALGVVTLLVGAQAVRRGRRKK